MKAIDQEITDILFGIHRRKSRSEGNNHQVIHIGFLQQADFFFKCVDQLQWFIWIYHFPGMGMKADDDRFAVHMNRFIHQRVNDLAVTRMNSVKCSDSNNCIGEGRQLVNRVMNLHNWLLRYKAGL